MYHATIAFGRVVGYIWTDMKYIMASMERNYTEFSNRSYNVLLMVNTYLLSCTFDDNVYEYFLIRCACKPKYTTLQVNKQYFSFPENALI